MSHEETVRRLDEFVDGRLSAAESRAVEEHLASCSVCRDELKRLGKILDAATELRDHSLQPEHDLWPGILARIGQETPGTVRAEAPRGEIRAGDGIEAIRPFVRGSEGDPERERGELQGRREPQQSRTGRSRAQHSRPGQPPPQPDNRWKAETGRKPSWWRWFMNRPVRLAWSAAVILIVASTLTIFFRSRGVPAPQGPLDPAVAQSIDLMEAETAKARADLSPALAAASRLSPEGPESDFQKNLDLLDQAIRDSRAALESSPQDPGLQRSLLGIYEKQLGLLRWAARVLQQTS